MSFPFEVVPLNPQHNVSTFSCGEHSLDLWLRRYALANQSVGSSRTFVLVESDNPELVLGYYSLTVVSVENETGTFEARYGMPGQYPLPAILLARLARDQKKRESGLGDLLLANAVVRTLSVARDVGVRLLAVQALNEKARDWYVSRGFSPSPIDDRLLMLVLSDMTASMTAT